MSWGKIEQEARVEGVSWLVVPTEIGFPGKVSLERSQGSKIPKWTCPLLSWEDAVRHLTVDRRAPHIAVFSRGFDSGLVPRRLLGSEAGYTGVKVRHFIRVPVLWSPGSLNLSIFHFQKLWDRGSTGEFWAKGEGCPFTHSLIPAPMLEIDASKGERWGGTIL